MKHGDLIGKFQNMVRTELSGHRNDFAEIHSRINDFLSSTKELRQEVFDHIGYLRGEVLQIAKNFSLLSDIRKEIARLSDRLKEAENLSIKLHQSQDDYRGLLANYATSDRLQKLMLTFEEKIQSHFKDHEEKIDQLKSDKNVDDRNLKLKLDELSLEIKKLRDEQEKYRSIIDFQNKKIEENMINADWAVKDMKKKQHAIFSLEKKFEYLDTRIDRLRGKQGE